MQAGVYFVVTFARNFNRNQLFETIQLGFDQLQRKVNQCWAKGLRITWYHPVTCSEGESLDENVFVFILQRKNENEVKGNQ